MAAQLKLEVVTPDRMVVSEMVDEVTVPGLDGELGILPEHTYLMSMLQTGVLSYRTQSSRSQLAVSGGYVEVQPDRVIVLAEVAERPDEIDIERARKARDEALQEVSKSDSELNLATAQGRLQRALNRLHVARRGTD
ncbi:MAG: F0F1 ATP synthase subunit epsilon [Acidobacteria bacterium]|nr:F0F1 ATP synthase subunit epsilon [Acidobacteriota bacterium]